MSVLIKGVKPSTRCYGCDFEIYGQYCVLLEKYTNNTRAIGRLDNCPVVGLPEKHGRLIDADALVPDICHDWNGWCVPPDDYSEECIRKAPTVIEAEDK